MLAGFVINNYRIFDIWLIKKPTWKMEHLWQYNNSACCSALHKGWKQTHCYFANVHNFLWSSYIFTLNKSLHQSQTPFLCKHPCYTDWVLSQHHLESSFFYFWSKVPIRINTSPCSVKYRRFLPAVSLFLYPHSCNEFFSYSKL